MPNLIEYAKLYRNELDKAAIQDSLTGWMDVNPSKVKYSGGKEVKVPQMSVDGLGDYNRGQSGGYAGGDIKFEYKTLEMTQDRGRKFTIDAMDVDESGFVVTAGNIMGEFQRTKVVPETDAYRLSKLATIAMNVAGDSNAKYNYAVEVASILAEIKLGIKQIRENGYNSTLIIHATYDVMNALEMAMSNKIISVDFAKNGINTKVPSIDQCPIIETPSNRMYSAITLYDGVSVGQEKGGYIKGASAVNANFIIAPVGIPIGVTKQDIMRIFDPLTNQSANGWSIDYRRYHDLWVLDNKKNSIYASFADAKPTA